MLPPSSLPMRTPFWLLQTTFPDPPALVGKLACASSWGSSVSGSATHHPPRRTRIPPLFQGAREGFRASTLRYYLPVDRLAGTAVGPPPAQHTYAVRHTTRIAGGYEVGSLFIQHSWQDPRELFRPSISHDPDGALYRKLVSSDGKLNHLYFSLVRDAGTNCCFILHLKLNTLGGMFLK